MFRLTASLLSVALVACTSPPPPDGTDHSAASVTPSARTPAPIGLTESVAPETPTPSLPAFEPGPGLDGWGPLAIGAAGTGSDFARDVGVLRITDKCTYLLDRNGQVRSLLVWPPEGVRWDAARRVIVFRNPLYRDPPGEVVELHDGQHIVMGGGGLSLEEDGPSAFDNARWTSPPDPSCSRSVRWYVGEVETDE